ncbi:uncharacterized protein [Triticum aestivum]|uniref:uncharacterized protein isoform X2 n=2 Tax=Triticum TaxID=4564 RepID=UPI001D020C7D|nr:uncharacterized protein LOC123091650 isoform X2 [Triticum aestivum]
MVPDQTLAKYRGRDQFFGKASVGHHPNSPLAPTPTRAPLLRSCPSHARSRPWLGFRAGQGSVFAAGAAPVDSDGSSPSPPSPPRAVPLPAGHEGQPGRIGLGLLCFRSVMDEEPLGRKGVYQPRSGARCAWSAATTFGPTTHGHFRDKLLHQNFAWRTSGTLGYIRSRRVGAASMTPNVSKVTHGRFCAESTQGSKQQNQGETEQTQKKKRMLHTVDVILPTPPSGVLLPQPGPLLPCTAAVNLSMRTATAMLQLSQPAGSKFNLFCYKWPPAPLYTKLKWVPQP